MSGSGRAVLTLAQRPGFLLLARIEARGASVRITVELNGAPVRSARRPTLTSALRWALRLSERVLDLFGQQGEVISLERAVRQASAQLAA
ncbi:MAG: hypothetical protein RMM58_01725 [Chloroflexota bacterium]|nr:hypothetical protein [Dehalococcoidia bacterium]MDW8252577.1 hypothetical protein [Chloroflexota bacterium]